MAEHPHPVDVAVGQAIRARRHAIGVSQEHLGELVGVSFQQIQKYENGANRVSCSRLVEIARALQCRPADFLPGSEAGETDRAEESAFFAQHGARELARQFVALDPMRQKAVRTSVAVVHATMDMPGPIDAAPAQAEPADVAA